VNTTAVSIDSLSKLYRLGEVGTGTLAHDLNRLWCRLTRKDDPSKKIGHINDREKSGADFVWALKDVSLDIAQGEVLGIVGRNGAGKSTLLKLLSRVTSPTQGTIRARGRIASLLEVGTGFHPELTGRENIYLNGAILGMSRTEVRTNLNDIVDFSGCAKYIDTPVKRYSSGMYVRLAFAVAAHLQAEILIVDEVLAVGDVDFQDKCLGKLREISHTSGRTVLFVSHNMGAVRRLCPSSILMENGQLMKVGQTADVIEQYLSSGATCDRITHWSGDDAPKNSGVTLREIAILDEKRRTDTALTSADRIYCRVSYTLSEAIHNLRVALNMLASDGTEIFSSSDFLYADGMRSPGNYVTECCIPANLLTSGRHIVSVDFDVPQTRALIMDQRVTFNIAELTTNQLGPTTAPRPAGVIHPVLDWTVTSERNAA
jgi:lipopolysaccharide transport system ATP-binding protein